MASSFEVMDRGHSKVLLHELNEQRIRGVFCDVTIVVQDSKFKAHKNILAAFSRYFKELLAGQSNWARDPVLELREMRAEVFAKILNFIYSSRVVVERLEEANDLASAGRQLGIHFLKDLLEASSRAGTCIDRPATSSSSSTPSSLAQSPDLSQMSQGPKEGRRRRGGGTDFEDDAAPLRRWPADPPFPSDALVGRPFPTDLTPPTSRRSGDEERTPRPYHSQSTSSRPDGAGDHPAERSGAVSPEREGGDPPPSQEGSGCCANESTSLNGLFQADFRNGASQEPAVDASEAEKTLYTLSTLAFRGLGFSVEDSGNSNAPPDKEPEVVVTEPDAAWALPPVNSPSEEEELGITKVPPADMAAAVSYPPSVPTCGLCARSFSTNAALSLHGRLHRAGKALSCRYCHKTFIHVKRLHTHQMLCRRSERAPSPGGLPSPGGQESPGGTGAEGSPGRPLGLLLAGGGDRKRRALPRMDILTEEEHFMKVVDGHLLYFCAVCERSYITLSSLKRHANVHSWRRKYPCRYCEKVFALAEYRTKHEVWHTGERRYQCIFCWETFVTYYNLKTHQKSFHGVDPGLTISQKTPNGGYKPKLNAFKLYRLLPMRSPKRPYKTYSHAMSAELLKYAQNAPAPLPADAPAESDLATLSQPSPAQSIQGESQPIRSRVPEGRGIPSAQDVLGRPMQRASPAGSARDGISPPPGASAAAHGEAAPGGGCPPGEGEAPQPPPAVSSPPPVSSVITYGRPASSVIVHSNALRPAVAHRSQSSVIAYNGRCARERGAGDPSPPPRQPVAARPPKKQAWKDSAQPQEKPSGPGAATNQRHHHQKEARSHKPKKHFPSAKGTTYVAKPACSGAAAESRGAPLCQITMRIGEEAIVKRRISESDLIRDTGSSGKGRRGEDPQAGGKRNCKDGAERESQHKSDYFLGNETGDEISDNDTDDNLWRPYYSYKPKRRSGGFHKAKKSGWRRKLRYRHSTRWLQRAAKDREALLDPMDCSPQDEEGTKEPENPSQPGGSSCSKTLCDRPSPEQDRWAKSAGRVFTCPTCGKEFSALKNLRKHEEAHLTPAELSCRFCARVFTLPKTLRKHEKTHGCQKLWAPPPQPPGEAPKPPTHGGGRRAASKHPCAHCSKTCKTAAALGRHQKWHQAEERSAVAPAGEASRPGQDGGSSEPFERAAITVHCPRPLEEDGALPTRGDRNGVTGAASTRGAGSVELLQRTPIAPYAEDCARAENTQETEMCPPGGSPSIAAQNPLHISRASGDEVPGREVGPALAVNPVGSMLRLHGEESRAADTPEAQAPYANASAPEAQAQEMHPAHSRGASGQSVPGSPAAVHGQERAAVPHTERSPLRDARDQGRDFHTLEPMIPREVAVFEQSEPGLEAARDFDYPTQDYPIPLITSGNFRSHTEGGKALAFQPGTVRFKEGGEDLSKVAFYQDPYQLVYGHQLLTGAYPYNFAHVSPLPVALNMVIRDEKGQQLPLLHRMFVYPTPCRDEAPALALAPPPSPNGSRDEAAHQLLAGEKGGPMY
ncbi:zinc finger and BTB domain-containing protein 38 [Scyliorhinus torazame]|uniref:zinc finger and BTB domain-containing protein 38 n=1 Tax=Scyliorhinus torazame TaxID=75743 RepID=UPI003B5C4A99